MATALSRHAVIRKASIALLFLAGACAAGRRAPEGPTAEVQTADGLRLAVPAGYRQRNAVGCFDRTRSIGRDVLEVMADLCVRRVLLAELDSAWLRSTPGFDSPGCADCARYTNSQVDTVHIGERRLVVQRARLTGTISGYRDHPALLVRVPLDSSYGAVLQGTYLRHADEELLRIAASIHTVP